MSSRCGVGAINFAVQGAKHVVRAAQTSSAPRKQVETVTLQQRNATVTTDATATAPFADSHVEKRSNTIKYDYYYYK